MELTLLVAATLLLVMSHVVPSAPGIRARLMASAGRRGFYAGYSLLSVLALLLVIWAWRAAAGGPWLYAPAYEGRLLAVALMPLALFLLVGRLTTKPEGSGPHGIYRLTAVPGSMALLLWALLHLPNLGEARTVVLFLGMAAIALLALVKNYRHSPPARRRAGILPFAAILTGRERLVWSEIGWWRLGAALALYLLLLTAHSYVIGVDPLAGILP